MRLIDQVFSSGVSSIQLIVQSNFLVHCISIHIPFLIIPFR